MERVEDCADAEPEGRQHTGLRHRDRLVEGNRDTGRTANDRNRREQGGAEPDGPSRPSARQVADSVGQGETGEEDEAGDGACDGDVGDRDDEEGHQCAGEADRRGGGTGAGREPRIALGKGPVGSHRTGEARRREEVRLHRGEHRQEPCRHDEPIAGRAHEVARGDGDQDLGVLCRQPGYGSVRGTHRDDEEEKRHVDDERGAERQEHRARDVALGIANLAAHRRDQVEALQCDEGVPHGLREAGESLREEGSEAIGQLAGRGGLGEEREEPGDNDHRENDDLPDRLPLAAAGRRAGQAPHVEAHRAERVDDVGEAAAQPRRGIVAQQPDDLLQEGREEDGEAERVEHCRDHRGEPDHPADREGGLHREDLARVGVGPPRLREPGGEFGVGEHRQKRDPAVEGEGEDRAGPRGLEGNPGEGEDAASHDRADTDAGCAEKPEVPLGVGGWWSCPIG